MKLGVRIGLGPGHIVSDGDQASPPLKGHSPQLNPSVQKPYKCTFSEIEKNAFKVVFTITF